MRLMYPWILALLALSTVSGSAFARSDAPDSRSTETTVQYLIDYVAESPLTFVRNGSRYSGREAAEHMKAKYEYYKDDIPNAETFIELCANKSVMTGRPYRVITTDGNQVPTREWLGRILERHRASRVVMEAADSPALRPGYRDAPGS